MWYCQTKVGTFWIRFDPYRSARFFLLAINDEALGSYYSPEAASDDVYNQRTGWPGWDELSFIEAPLDLTQWTREDCKPQ